jgi:hypothetical protein
LTPFGSRFAASVESIAPNGGSVSRESKSGAGCVSLRVSLFPFAVMPEMVDALPLVTSDTPTMAAPSVPSMNGVTCDAIFGSTTRSNAHLKFFAVTG